MPRPKKILTEEEIVEKMERKKELGRLRSKKHYDNNKEKILLRMKQNNQEIKEKYKNIIKNIPTVNPEIEVQQPQEENDDATIEISPKVKKTKKQILDLETTIDLMENFKYNSPHTKTTHINNIKTFFRITDCNDFTKCLKHFQKIVDFLENTISNRGDVYSTNSKKVFTESILLVITTLNLNVPKTVIQKYKDYFNLLKIKSSNETDEKAKSFDFSITSFKNYLKMNEERFGKDSKEHIISLLYKEVPVRDDFYLKIVDKKYNTNDTNNYLVLKNNKLLDVIINSYKTDKKYGQLTFHLSKALSKNILNYMKSNNIELGDHLFGKSPTNSDFVSKMNKKMGLAGGTTLFRKMTVSELLKNHPDDKQRIELANKMAHSPYASMKYYLRIIDDDDD